MRDSQIQIKTKTISRTSITCYRIGLLQDGYIAASGRNYFTNLTVPAVMCNVTDKKMCSQCHHPHHLAQEILLPGL
jgi:hypothetical protein